jgi:hypothetical protein
MRRYLNSFFLVVMERRYKMSSEAIGNWAFIIGLIVAVIAGFLPISYVAYTLLVLFILGLIVGFMNISDKDLMKFLVAAIALMTLGIASLSALSILGVVSIYLNLILGNFVAFVSASALVVSIKAVIETSKK